MTNTASERGPWSSEASANEELPREYALSFDDSVRIVSLRPEATREHPGVPFQPVRMRWVPRNGLRLAYAERRSHQ